MHKGLSSAASAAIRERSIRAAFQQAAPSVLGNCDCKRAAS